MSAKKQKASPLLSIIVTTLDNSEGVVSLLKNTPKRVAEKVEYVIVDDGSSKEHAKVLDSINIESPRVTLTHNPSNLGVVESQLLGAKRATGYYLLFRGADDSNLAALWELLEHTVSPKSYKLIAGDILKRPPNASAAYHESSAWLPVGESRFFPADEFQYTVKEKQIWGQSAIVSRDTFFEYSGFLPELSFASDPMLFHTIAFQEGIFYTATPLSIVDIDPASFSSTGNSKQTPREEALKAVISFVDSLPSKLKAAYANSAWLGRWGSDLARIYLASPESWSSSRNLLLQRNLHYLEQERDLESARGIEAPYFRNAVERILSETTEPLNYESRIGIFGGGSAAKQLLLILERSPLPRPTRILTNDPFQAEQKQLHGIPISLFDELEDGELDHLIIASKTYQETLAAQAAKRFPNLTITCPFPPLREFDPPNSH